MVYRTSVISHFHGNLRTIFVKGFPLSLYLMCISGNACAVPEKKLQRLYRWRFFFFNVGLENLLKPLISLIFLVSKSHYRFSPDYYIEFNPSCSVLQGLEEITDGLNHIIRHKVLLFGTVAVSVLLSLLYSGDPGEGQHSVQAAVGPKENVSLQPVANHE